jgi:hypothetical protein
LAAFAKRGEQAVPAPDPLELKVAVVAVAPQTKARALTLIFFPETAATSELSVWEAATLAKADPLSAI